MYCYLFNFFSGDDRNIKEVFVSGRLIHSWDNPVLMDTSPIDH